MLHNAQHAYISNEFEQAALLCQQIMAFSKNNPDAQTILSRIDMKQGQPDKAESDLRLAIKQHPRHPGLIACLGTLYREQGNYLQSLTYWKQYTRLCPRGAEGWQALATTLCDLSRWSDADTPARTALKLAPKHSPSHANLGRILQMQNRYDEASVYMRKAIELAPDNTKGLYNLARLLMETGELDEARQRLLQLLEIEPEHANAIYLYCRHTKFTAFDSILNIAEDILSNESLPSRNRGIMGFSLGQAWADLGDYDKSFAYYKQGNQHFRNEIDYNIDDDRRMLEVISTTFTKELFHAHADSNRGKNLIFVLGMPRSGSSLVARILDAHAKTVDTGETDTLGFAVHNILSPGEAFSEVRDFPFPNICHITPKLITQATTEYSNALHAAFGKHARYIDKTLYHHWLVGVIHILFPKAKIVHAHRDPLDNCLSIYSTSFEGRFFKFAYDLKELGGYYQIYSELMEHWRTTLPEGVMYEIANESLIADPEGEMRRLVAFCELEWDDSFLKFHEKRGVVKTQSLSQVRSGISNKSIGRWKPYEKHLQPLIDALGDAIQQSR